MENAPPMMSDNCLFSGEGMPPFLMAAGGANLQKAVTMKDSDYLI